MQEYIKIILGSDHCLSSSTSRNNTTSIISNDEINHIIKIIKSLEDSGYKELLKQFKMKQKNKKKNFLVC